MPSTRSDAEYDPLSVSHWTHEDRQLSMHLGWSIEIGDRGYQIVTWYPLTVINIAIHIRKEAEAGSRLHMKARNLLAAQKIKDAAAGRT